MSLTPTGEQQAAVDAFRTGGNLVIEAAAGTGKTSTLRLLADVFPEKRGLYVAFNKAIQVEAERKFADTAVTAKTAHSLAYAQFGRPLAEKLGRGNRMRAAERAEILGIRHKVYLGRLGDVAVPKHVIARIAGESVARFCRSAATEITADHVVVPPSYSVSPELDTEFRNMLLPYVQRYWQNVLDPKGTLPVNHDVYLKQWSLSRPQLDYDYILFDEAQDADEATASVVGIQNSTQIVAVGDRSQAIYGWRGAVDSMDYFGGDTFQLTQSFRFGHAIAEEANQWLNLLEATLRVRGSDKPSSCHETLNRIPEAVLTRTNAGAITEVINLLRRGGGTVAIGGKGKAKQLRDLAEAAQTLIKEGWTRHPELDQFESWDAVRAYVDEDEDAELAPLVKLIDNYGPDFLIRSIDACVDPSTARTTVATAHVAKGLEWFHVRIGDDFKVPSEDEVTHTVKPLSTEDLMLNYVAVTRAMRHLDPGGLGFVRDYARVLRRPEMGMEWRRRFYAQRTAFANEQEARSDQTGAA